MYRRIEIENFRFGINLSDFSVTRALEDEKRKEKPGGILIHSFGAFPEMDLEKEMTGETDCIRRLTALSKESDGAVFCGARTSVFDMKHISVIVCNKGRLVDIVDRTLNPLGDEFTPTNKIKIFATDSGKAGLLIDTDCLIESNWGKTAPFSDIMLCINRGNSESAREEVRLFSAAYKLPYLYIDEECAEWRG